MSVFRIAALFAALVTWSTCDALRAQDREEFYRRTALVAAARYLQPRLYTYAPQADPKEVAASTVAINGHILLEAFKVDGDRKWLDAAIVAGRTLVEHSDMNRDGKVGWGRFWNLAAPSGDAFGGNTTFVRGCDKPRTKAYDDELYDDARITHFLIELSATSKDPAFVQIAQKSIDDTWGFGKTTNAGKGFGYFKTIGPCDDGWLVKNVNMLMVVPMALLSQGKANRYRDRAEAMLFAQTDEINRKVKGKPAPNFGYYAVQTMVEKPKLGQYVEVAQTTDVGSPITCNLKTGSGESCTSHLGIEARGYAFGSAALGQPASDYKQVAIDIMHAADIRDQDMCQHEKTSRGSIRPVTACVAYHCALRQLDRSFDDRCFRLVSQYGPASQDIILGLFWGRAGRF